MPPCRHGSCLFAWLAAFSIFFWVLWSPERGKGARRLGQGGGRQEKNSLALLESWESSVNKWASAGLIVSFFLLESRSMSESNELGTTYTTGQKPTNVCPLVLLDVSVMS